MNATGASAAVEAREKFDSGLHDPPEGIFQSVLERARAIPTMTFATSQRLRRQLFDFVVNTSESGPVIEIGSYKGGTSVFLASASALSGRDFHIVDVSPAFLEDTRRHVEIIAPDARVHYFCGTADEYFATRAASEHALLVFIDADHRYRAVRKDIRAVLSAGSQPKYWVFHDFNLRGTAPARQDILVDKAIRDEFGADLAYERWGGQFPDGKPQNSGGDYILADGSEAIFVDFVGDSANAAALKKAAVSKPVQTANATRNWNDLILLPVGEIMTDLDRSASEDDNLKAVGLVESKYPQAFQKLAHRYFGTVVPEIAVVLSRLTDERFAEYYFVDFAEALKNLPPDDVALIESTRQDFDASSVLNDYYLNLLGLDLYRARFIESRLRQNRLKVYPSIMKTNLAPQSPDEIDEMFRNFETIENNGFVALENVTIPNQENLCAELNDDFVMQSQNLSKIDGSTPLYRMGLSSKVTPTAIEILRHRRFFPLYKFICGRPIEPTPACTEFIVQDGVEGSIDGNKTWHIDTFHSNFKWWYFFEGVTLEQGPLGYIPGSNRPTARRLMWLYLKSLHAAIHRRQGSISRAYRVTDGDIAFLELGDPVYFDVAPRTLVITNNIGVHRRSEPLEKGIIRRALFGWARAELIEL